MHGITVVLTEPLHHISASEVFCTMSTAFQACKLSKQTEELLQSFLVSLFCAQPSDRPAIVNVAMQSRYKNLAL